jgi:hypothetical protein
MADYIGFLHADKTYSVKKVKSFPKIYNYKGKDYVIDSSSIHLRKSFFGLKRYLFFQEDRFTPLPDVPDNSKIQALITAIERDHTVAEFLHEFRQNQFMLIFVGVFGMVLGIAIGIIIAPHILAGLK